MSGEEEVIFLGEYKVIRRSSELTMDPFSYKSKLVLFFILNDF